MEIPFYLQPTTTQNSQPDVFAATEWSYDYDYQSVPEPQGTKTFWEEMAAGTSQTADAVWDTAKGTWETVKGAGASIVNSVDSVSNKITDNVFGAIDSLLWRVVMVFAVIILALWVLGKAGVIGDVVAGILAVKA